MVSNRLIALALVAALVQAWILSFRLAAATSEKAAADPTHTPRLSAGAIPAQSQPLHCQEQEIGWHWLLLDPTPAGQLAAPAGADEPLALSR